MNQPQNGCVYESPDGGKTIYRRKVNDTNRELHRKDGGEPIYRANPHISKPVQINVIDDLYDEIGKIRTCLFRLERKIDRQADIVSRKEYLDCENRDIYDVIDEMQTYIVERISKLENNLKIYEASRELSESQRAWRRQQFGE